MSEQWVRDHSTRRTPKLPCVRLGSAMRYLPSAVDAFITEQAKAAPWRRRRGKN
jgi:hypothetical protein